MEKLIKQQAHICIHLKPSESHSTLLVAVLTENKLVSSYLVDLLLKLHRRAGLAVTSCAS